MSFLPSQDHIRKCDSKLGTVGEEGRKHLFFKIGKGFDWIDDFAHARTFTLHITQLSKDICDNRIASDRRNIF